MTLKEKIRFTEQQDQVLVYAILRGKSASNFPDYVFKSGHRIGEPVFTKDEIRYARTSRVKTIKDSLKAFIRNPTSKKCVYSERYFLPADFDVNKIIVHRSGLERPLPKLTVEQYQLQLGSGAEGSDSDVETCPPLPSEPEPSSPSDPPKLPPFDRSAMGLKSGSEGSEKASKAPKSSKKNAGRTSTKDDTKLGGNRIGGTEYDHVVRLKWDNEQKTIAKELHPWPIIASFQQNGVQKDGVSLLSYQQPPVALIVLRPLTCDFTLNPQYTIDTFSLNMQLLSFASVQAVANEGVYIIDGGRGIVLQLPSSETALVKITRKIKAQYKDDTERFGTSDTLQRSLDSNAGYISNNSSSTDTESLAIIFPEGVLVKEGYLQEQALVQGRSSVHVEMVKADPDGKSPLSGFGIVCEVNRMPINWKHEEEVDDAEERRKKMMARMNAQNDSDSEDASDANEEELSDVLADKLADLRLSSEQDHVCIACIFAFLF